MTRSPKRALLLFSQKSADKALAYPQDLARLLTDAGKGLEASAVLLEDLLFFMDESGVEVIDTANNRPLTDYDVIYFRHWGDAEGQALAAARYCKLKQIPFVDGEVLRTGSFNKITQYMNLFEAGVPFPKTLVANARQLLSRYGQYGFTFPLVLKSASGTRGQDNYQLHNEAQMRQVLEQNSQLLFVMQSFLPNNGDYRVVVLGDQVAMAVKRTAANGTHLNNTSQGAKAEPVAVEDMPQAMRDLSVRAARFFDRQVAGVDMVQSANDGRWYCFEVNRAPQIEHSSFEQQKATLLAEYLSRLANKH